MKKKLIALVAIVSVLAMLGAQALATTGDLTIQSVKVYSDSEMKNYIGTLPALTSVLVRSYDSFADIYIDGKLCYIDASSLLHKNIASSYSATLKKDTKVYQCPSINANAVTLKKDCTVRLCAASGSWALVRATDKRGAYAFVLTENLTNLKNNK